MKLITSAIFRLIFSVFLLLPNTTFGQNTATLKLKTIVLKSVALSPTAEKRVVVPINQRGILRIDIEPIPLSIGDSFVFVLKHLTDSLKTKTVCPTVQYTHLEGGDYTLLCSLDKKGQKTVALSLPIVIQKTLIEQLWFQLAIALSGALLIFGLSFLWLQYNYRQKMREQRMLLNISFDLHDRIGSALTSINVWGKILKRDTTDVLDTESNENLQKIIATSKETVNALRETVWSINPEYNDMGQLFEKMRASAFDILVPQNIAVDFDYVLKDLKDMSISMGQRGAVFHMFKEIVTNITKHAEAKHVKINISREKYQVRFIIQDDGKGFDILMAHPDKVGSVGDGHGLKSLRQRADDHFIQLDIQSEIGKGTTIILVIPEL